VTDGRVTKCSLSEIIRTAEGKHSVRLCKASLKEKLLKRGDAKTLAQHHACRKQEIDKELTKCPQDFIDEARSKIIASLQKKMDASKQKVREASQKVLKNENCTKAFKLVSFAGKAPLSDATNNLKRDALSTGSQQKKIKNAA
jgi:hypothetical protein